MSSKSPWAGTHTGRRIIFAPQGIGREIVGILRAFGIERINERLADNADFVSVAVRRTSSRSSSGQASSRLAEALAEQGQQLLRKIEWANIVGNIAPIVGLFGTVFGMIKTFNGIVAAGGQPSPGHLAAGISVALVTTLWGLLVAIPALVIHGIFRNRIESIVSEAAQEAEVVLREINAGFRRQEQPVRAQEKTDEAIKEIKQTKHKVRRIIATR